MASIPSQIDHNPIQLQASPRRNDDQHEDTPNDCNADHSEATANDSNADVHHPRSYLAWITAEITRGTRKAVKRHDTRFFQVVTGGNVKFVEEVVQHLITNAKLSELQWVFGGDMWSCNERSASPGCYQEPSLCVRFINRLMFPVVFILYVCSIPIFYLWHVMLHSVYLAFRQKVSKHVDLPLIFALLSEEKTMVQLFLSYGATIHQQDTNMNNVYHYLADISVNDPDKAIKCHRILCSCINDVSEIHDVLTEQENDIGLTGFEAIAKYGSLRFYRTISHDESCIGRPLLTVSHREIWADTKLKHYHILFGQRNNESSHSKVNADSINLNILEFDVSMYEQGDFLGRQSYPLQLITSRGVDSMAEADVNAVLESRLLGHWMGSKFTQYVPYCFVGHFLYLGVTVLLLFYIAQHDGYPYPFQLLPNFLQIYRKVVANVVNSTQSYGQQVNISVPSFAKLDYIVDESSNCIDTAVYVDGDPDEPFNGCQVDASKKMLEQCPSLTLTDVLWKVFIMDKEEHDHMTKTNTRILYTICVILGITAFLNAIVVIGFLCVNYNFDAPSPLRVMLPVLSRRLPGSYTDRQLVTLMCVFFACYMYSHSNLISILESINNVTFTDNNRSMGIFKDNSDTLDLLITEQESTESVCTTLLIICLLLQFLHAIHALRLLPGIGFFVITTKKMAKHLVQFALVFVIVSLAFATIFHFVMRDKNCPALKMVGFTGLSESLFSTYQVALGQGEHEFTYNFNSKLAYTTYTVITVLLLLNLIIAVMTTTAQELNRLPWKHALCRFELWDEILGTEVNVLIIKSIFLRINKYIRRRCGRIDQISETNSHKKF